MKDSKYTLDRLSEASPQFLQELEMWMEQREFWKRNKVQRAVATVQSTSNYTLLKSITLAGSGSLAWGLGTNGSIPQTYRDLIIVIVGQTNTVTDVDQICLKINSDTASNYGYDGYDDNNGALGSIRNSATTQMIVGAMPGSNSRVGSIEITLHAYATTGIKTGFAFSSSYKSGAIGSTNNFTWMGFEYFNVPAAAVTKLDFLTGTGTTNTWAAGTRADIYGRGNA